MTVLSLLFSRGPSFSAAALLLGVMGFAGGSFAVPVMAIIQHRPSARERAAYAFIRTARRHPFRMAMADASGGIRFGSALVRAEFLARRLAPEWKGQDMVGILLPPSPAAALVNFGALFSGKIPVNLNYTLSSEGIASCVRSAPSKR
jgi:acyl-[acyl-carrier-protein]-phospholipid O-acyltransferase / long-chain-fatty-acid--[acyl-carrier-protein] ligase